MYVKSANICSDLKEPPVSVSLNSTSMETAARFACFPAKPAKDRQETVFLAQIFIVYKEISV